MRSIVFSNRSLTAATATRLPAPGHSLQCITVHSKKLTCLLDYNVYPDKQHHCLCVPVLLLSPQAH
jgi:hypothetical protein